MNQEILSLNIFQIQVNQCFTCLLDSFKKVEIFISMISNEFQYYNHTIKLLLCKCKFKWPSFLKKKKFDTPM